MEIEEFIDQDILIYLDEVLEKVRSGADKQAAAMSAIYLTRDYEKELFAALDKNEIVQAKKILAALKEQFDQCPAGTQDKEQLRTLLLDLYTKFKNQVDTMDKFTAMDSRLDEVLGAVAAKSAEGADASFLTPMLDNAELHFVNGELQEAVDAYRMARQRAIDEKVLVPLDIAMRFRTMYARIKFALGNTQGADAASALPPPLGERNDAALSSSVDFNSRRPAEFGNAQIPQNTSNQNSPTQTRSSIDERIALATKQNTASAAQASTAANIPSAPGMPSLAQRYATSQAAQAASQAAPRVMPPEAAPMGSTSGMTPSAGQTPTWALPPAQSTATSQPTATQQSTAAQQQSVVPAQATVSMQPPLANQQGMSGAMSAEELDHQALLQLEQEKMLLDDMLKRNDLMGSVQQYKRMRLIAQQLSDAERARVAAEKLLRIHDIITDMRKHAANDESKLTAVP